jgi:hypothetical protein
MTLLLLAIHHVYVKQKQQQRLLLKHEQTRTTGTLTEQSVTKFNSLKKFKTYRSFSGPSVAVLRG